MDVYTLLYLKWVTKKDLLYSTGNSAQCYMAAWMGGEFGREWIPVCVWLSPFAIHLKLSQHCLLICFESESVSRSVKSNSATPWTTGSSVHGILQARILERVAFPFSWDLPDPGIEARFPTLQTFFTIWATREYLIQNKKFKKIKNKMIGKQNT